MIEDTMLAKKGHLSRAEKERLPTGRRMPLNRVGTKHSTITPYVDVADACLVAGRSLARQSMDALAEHRDNSVACVLSCVFFVTTTANHRDPDIGQLDTLAFVTSFVATLEPLSTGRGHISGTILSPILAIHVAA